MKFKACKEEKSPRRLKKSNQKTKRKDNMQYILNWKTYYPSVYYWEIKNLERFRHSNGQNVNLRLKTENKTIMTSILKRVYSFKNSKYF